MRPMVALWGFLLPATFLVSSASAQKPSAASEAAAELVEPLSRILAPYAAAPVALLDERTSYYWNEENAEWQAEGRSLFKYNGVYRVEEVQQAWTGSQFEPSMRLEYSGDELANVTATYQWNAAASAFEPVDRTDYNYLYDLFTGERVIESEVYSMWDGSEYVPVERTTYTFGETLIYTASQSDEWDGSAWKPVDRQTLIEENAQVIVISQEWQDGAWMNTERISYPYPTREALYDELRRALATATDFEGLLYLLQLMPSGETQAWTGTEWVPAARQSTSYDFATGRKLHIDFEEYEDGEWITSMRLAFNYETNGSLSGMSWLTDMGDGTFAPFLHEHYAWDSQGSVTTISSSMDLGTGVMSTARVDYVWRYVGTAVDRDETPTTFTLEAAYPNPFNPSTQIDFELERGVTAASVSIRVFDAAGRQVATLFDGVQAAGRHGITFDAADLPSGTYLVRLETPAGRTSQMVTLLK